MVSSEPELGISEYQRRTELKKKNQHTSIVKIEVRLIFSEYRTVVAFYSYIYYFEVKKNEELVTVPALLVFILVQRGF